MVVSPGECYQDDQGPRERVLLGVVEGPEHVGEEGKSKSTLWLLQVELKTWQCQTSLSSGRWCNTRQQPQGGPVQEVVRSLGSWWRTWLKNLLKFNSITVMLHFKFVSSFVCSSGLNTLCCSLQWKLGRWALGGIPAWVHFSALMGEEHNRVF